MKLDPVESEHLDDEVRRERARHDRSRRERRAGIGEQVARAGAIGWLIVVPTVAGAFAGRRIDRAFDTGITFAAALLVAGLATGCYLAARLLHREGKRR